MKSSAPKALQTGLCLLLFFPAIFFGAVHEWSSMFFACVLFAVLFFQPHFFLNFKFLPRYFQAVLAAVFFYLLLQAFHLSLNPWLTRVELLKWLACGVLFLLIRGLPIPSLEILLKTVIFMAALQALYGLVQTQLHYPWVLWRAQEKFEGFATGTFLNRNQLAGLLEMGMGVTAGYLLKSLYHRSKREIVLYALVLTLTFLALVQTGSRMGLFSFLAASAAGCSLLSFRREGFPLFIFSIIFLGGAVAAFLFGHQEFAARFSSIEDPWGGRLQAWRDTLEMVRQNFWLGTGLGTYGWVFPGYQSPSSLMGWTHAHQDYLELTAGLGLPVFLIWGAGFLIFFFRTFRETVELKENGFFFVRWGIGCGLSAFLLHGLTDFNWSVPALSFLFFALLTIAAALTRPQPESGALKKNLNTALRALCLVLLLSSGQKAWAGVYAYSAGRALGVNDYDKAASQARNSLKIEAGNPSVQFTLGKSLYEKARKTQDASVLREAGKFFLEVTGKHPEYSRAWIYLGLTSESFPEMKRNFLEGLRREPGSGWSLYKTSVSLLSRPELLTENEKQDARERLKLSFSLHYKDQVSPYLAPAARILWKSARDFETILYAVPEDFLSYRTLLNTVESQGIWEYRDRVYGRFLKLSGEEYERKCAEAESLLAVGQKRRAFGLFQESYWLRQELSPAKIGMLEAGSPFDPPLYKGAEAEKWLKEILLNENSLVLKDRLQRISAAAEKIRDPFIKGLWYYRLGNWEEAVRIFSQDYVSTPKTRRWKADAYNQLGEKEKAVKILLPVLTEKNPDLRELILLKQIDPKNALKAEAKIREIISLSSSYAFGPLQDNKSGLWVNLMPGKTEVRIMMKLGLSESKPVYVKLQMWDGEKTEPLGGAYVFSTDWKIYPFYFSTSGGGRLLTLQPVNTGPRLELGPIKIKTVPYE